MSGHWFKLYDAAKHLRAIEDLPNDPQWNKIRPLLDCRFANSMPGYTKEDDWGIRILKFANTVEKGPCVVFECIIKSSRMIRRGIIYKNSEDITWGDHTVVLDEETAKTGTKKPMFYGALTRLHKFQTKHGTTSQLFQSYRRLIYYHFARSKLPDFTRDEDVKLRIWNVKTESGKGSVILISVLILSKRLFCLGKVYEKDDKIVWVKRSTIPSTCDLSRFARA